MSPSVRQLNMRAYKEQHGESVIPKGLYCYETLGFDGHTPSGLPIMKTKVCPYWDIDEDRPKQMNGFCWFMEKGDWHDGGGGLLWH